MTFKEIISSIIDSEHGWSVAEQFIDTIYDRSEDNLSRQNLNALYYIKTSVEGLIESSVFNQHVEEEMIDYVRDLKEFISLQK